MRPDAPLARIHVLMVGAGRFTADYVDAVLVANGATITGARTGIDVDRVLGDDAAHFDIAVVDLGTPDADLLAGATKISERGLPALLLLGARVGAPDVPGHHASIRQRFAAFQVVECMSDLVRKASRTSDPVAFTPIVIPSS